MNALLSPPELGRPANRPDTPAEAGPREPAPAGPDTAAEELLGRLRRAVEARAGRRLRDLRVEVVTGEAGVVLHGRADCFYAKQLAQHVVARVTGLRVLANRIVVLPAPHQGRY